MAPASLAFYSTMARRRLKGMHAARWDTDGIDRQYLAEYRLIAGEMSADLERAEQALATGMTPEYFEQRKSRTNSALEQVLGRQLATPYLVHGDGRKPHTRFGLRIEAEGVRFGPVDDVAASLRESDGRVEIGDNVGQEEMS